MLIYGVYYRQRPAPKALPLTPWVWEGVVFQKDYAVSAHSRLRAKFLLFGTVEHFQNFGHKFAYGGNIRGASGAVMYCADNLDKAHKDIWFVDPNYFGVLAIPMSKLSLDTIAHEAVHLASTYSFRTQGRKHWPGQKTDPDEALAWPTGRLTAAIWQDALKFTSRIRD